jgi:hypothetical protein
MEYHPPVHRQSILLTRLMVKSFNNHLLLNLTEKTPIKVVVAVFSSLCYIQLFHLILFRVNEKYSLSDYLYMNDISIY